MLTIFRVICRPLTWVTMAVEWVIFQMSECLNWVYWKLSAFRQWSLGVVVKGYEIYDELDDDFDEMYEDVTEAVGNTLEGAFEKLGSPFESEDKKEG